MEPIQDDRCPMCGATADEMPGIDLSKPGTKPCTNLFHMEPIQDDIETIRNELDEPDRPDRALLALDRLVAECDRLKDVQTAAEMVRKEWRDRGDGGCELRIRNLLVVALDALEVS